MLHVRSSIGNCKRYFAALAIFVSCIYGMNCSRDSCLTVASSVACYYIHEGSDTWWEAALKCSGKEGHLVELHAQNEFIELKRKLGELYEGIYYIGLIKMGPSPWFWYTTGRTLKVSGEVLRREEGLYTAQCIAIDFRYKPEGSIKPISCDEKIGYICESPEKAALHGTLLEEE